MRRSHLAVAATALTVLTLLIVAACSKSSKNPTSTGASLELSMTLGPTATYEHRFFTANDYHYHCNIHSSMHGVVTVSATAPASDSLMTVIISGTAFNLSAITIPVGGKVTWVNNDPFTHTVTSD